MSPLRDDFWAVRQAWLVAVVFLTSVGVLLWLVPTLFNAHDSFDDYAALVLAGLALSLAYIAGRALWRRIAAKLGEVE